MGATPSKRSRAAKRSWKDPAVRELRIRRKTEAWASKPKRVLAATRWAHRETQELLNTNQHPVVVELEELFRRAKELIPKIPEGEGR